MASLYKLSVDFLQAANQLEDLDIDQEIISDTLESLQIPIEAKAENIIKFVRNLEAMAEARKAEAKRLTEQAAKDAKKAEGLLKYLDSTLKMLGKETLTAGVFQVSYKKGSEVVEVDENQLPQEYFVPTFKPMTKTELKYLVKNESKIIPGVKVIRNPDKLVIK